MPLVPKPLLEASGVKAMVPERVPSHTNPGTAAV